MADCGDLSLSVSDSGVTLTTPEQVYAGAPLGEETLDGLARLRQESGPKEYGRALFDALFVDELREGYSSVLAPRSLEWRVQLRVESSTPGLDTVWWEALIGSGPPPLRFGTSYRTPFSRRLAFADTDRGELADEKVKVLVVISNPTDLEAEWRLPRLDEGAVIEQITSAMAGVKDRIECEIHTTPADVPSIRHLLATKGFHVLHLYGYGTAVDKDGEACLLLEGQDEESHPVDSERLAELVMSLRDLRLVILSACGMRPPAEPDSPAGHATAEPLTHLVPQMIEYGLPAAVAMQECVDTELAMRFTESFYGELARSDSGRVDEVINRTRDTMYYQGEDTWEWTAPALFVSGPGVLFKEPAGDAPVDSTSTVGPTATRQQHWRPERGRDEVVSGGKRVLPVSGGKPIGPAPDERERQMLLVQLTRLNLSATELSRLAAEAQLPLADIHGETLEERCIAIVDRAWRSGKMALLRGRVEATGKARQAPNVYDFEERRLVHGARF